MRAEDLDPHMQAMIAWAEEVDVKAKSLKRLKKIRRNNSRQNTSRLLFNWETKYESTIHERTLGRGKVRMELHGMDH